MKNILCFGDSNTYGLSPEWVYGKFGRHDFNTRWTGRLQKQLGEKFRIIEEGLNGRTTVFEDPTSPCRCGYDYFQPCIESHNPLDMIIIMLGTNDTKGMFNAGPMEIAMGLSRLIQVAKNPSLYMGCPVPKILIAVPVPIGEVALDGADGITTRDMINKSKALAPAYKRIAEMYGCEYIDLGQITQTAPFEGVHLTAESHALIADAFEKKIREML